MKLFGVDVPDTDDIMEIGQSLFEQGIFGSPERAAMYAEIEMGVSIGDVDMTGFVPEEEPVDDTIDDEEAKGGPGSGNWGHTGRPGVVGGSQGGGGHSRLLQQYGYSPRGAATPEEPKAPEKPKVAWKPSMTRDEAEAWAAGSAIQQDTYHVTPKENAASIEAKELEEIIKGFDLSKRRFGRVWGDGVYMTDDQDTVEMYRGWVGGKRDSSTLTMKVNVKNVYTQDLNQKDVYKIGVLAEAMKTNPSVVGKAKDEFEFMDKHGGFEKAMQALGYDALRIVAPSASDISSGGNQLVIFDPKNVVVIKGR